MEQPHDRPDGPGAERSAAEETRGVPPVPADEAVSRRPDHDTMDDDDPDSGPSSVPPQPADFSPDDFE